MSADYHARKHAQAHTSKRTLEFAQQFASERGSTREFSSSAPPVRGAVQRQFSSTKDMRELLGAFERKNAGSSSKKRRHFWRVFSKLPSASSVSANLGINNLLSEGRDTTWDEDDARPREASLNFDKDDDVAMDDATIEGFKGIGDVREIDPRKEGKLMLSYWLLAVVVLIPGMVLQLVDRCHKILGLCVGVWAVGAAAAIATYPLIQLVVKSLSSACTASHLMHISHVYFFVRLHKLVAHFLWAIFLYCAWVYVVKSYADIEAIRSEFKTVRRVIACHLAWKTLWLVKNILVLELAHKTLWTPYLARVKQSIFAQYTIMILTDFAADGIRRDLDQAVALKFAAQDTSNESMSLFAISKAVSFVPSKRLQGVRPGPGGEAIDIYSTRSARQFARYLFQMLCSTIPTARKSGMWGTERRSSCSSTEGSDSRASPATAAGAAAATATAAAAAAAASGSAAPSHGGSGSEAARLSRAPTAAAAANGRLFHRSAAAPAADLQIATPPLMPATSASAAVPALPLPPVSPSSVEAGLSQSGHNATTTAAAPSVAASTMPIAAPAAAVRPSPRVRVQSQASYRSTTTLGRGSRSGTATAEQAAVEAANQVLAAAAAQAAAAAAAAEARREEAEDDDFFDDAAEPEPEVVLTLQSLKPALCKPLAIKTLELLDNNADAEITESEFMDAIVRIFQVRKSLSLTLMDYEVILKKLSYIISTVFLFILVFVCLAIFDQDIVTILVPWVSFLLAFGFMFGSSAQAFCESCIFIFVTRAYDVGDTVHLKDDIGSDTVFVVQRINIMTTVLKRWDGQYVIMPNQALSKKEVRNMRRSAAAANCIFIAVTRRATVDDITALREGLRAAAKAAQRADHAIVPESINVVFRNVLDGARVELCIPYQHRDTWQDNGERWKSHGFLMKHIVTLCSVLRLEPGLVEQPVRIVEGSDAPFARSASEWGPGGLMFPSSSGGEYGLHVPTNRGD